MAQNSDLSQVCSVHSARTMRAPCAQICTVACTVVRQRCFVTTRSTAPAPKPCHDTLGLSRQGPSLLCRDREFSIVTQGGENSVATPISCFNKRPSTLALLDLDQVPKGTPIAIGNPYRDLGHPVPAPARSRHKVFVATRS